MKAVTQKDSAHHGMSGSMNSRTLGSGRGERPRFGMQRLVAAHAGAMERMLFRFMGVADPAHYLHHRYLEQALASIPSLQPQRILDAGCGRGDYAIYLAQRYPDARVLAIDVDEKRIARNVDTARRLGLGNLDFQVADVCELSLVDEFDLIVSIDVLEHIVNQNGALTALGRALRPRGVAYYHIPTVREKPVPFSGRLADFHAWAEEEHVAEDHTHTSFVTTVRRSGLQVVRAQRTFGYFTGELATSIFALPYRNTPLNRILQGLLAPACRALTWADRWGIDKTRYAVGVLCVRPSAQSRDESRPRQHSGSVS